MTSIFCIPLRDGVIVCADRLSTCDFIGSFLKKYSLNNFSGNKIYSTKDYVFAFSGDEALSSSLKELFLSLNGNFDAFNKVYKTDVQRQIAFQVNLANENDELDKEELGKIIDDIYCQGFFLNKNDLGVKVIDSRNPTIVDTYPFDKLKKGQFKGIGTGVLALDKGGSVNLKDIIGETLSYLRLIDVKQFKENFDLNLKSLIFLLELSSRMDSFTGHPSCYGANIVVVSKLSIDSFDVRSKGIMYSISEKGDWKDANWWA